MYSWTKAKCLFCALDHQQCWQLSCSSWDCSLVPSPSPHPPTWPVQGCGSAVWPVHCLPLQPWSSAWTLGAHSWSDKVLGGIINFVCVISEFILGWGRQVFEAKLSVTAAPLLNFKASASTLITQIGMPGMCPHWSVVVGPTTVQSLFTQATLYHHLSIKSAEMLQFCTALTESNHHSDHPGHISGMRVHWLRSINGSLVPRLSPSFFSAQSLGTRLVWTNVSVSSQISQWLKTGHSSFPASRLCKDLSPLSAHHVSPVFALSQDTASLYLKVNYM